MTGIKLVLCTAPDRDTADDLATHLVEERIAACVNILPNITSIYRWEGAVEESTEVLMLIKLSADQVEHAQRYIASQHPYDTPEFIVIDVEAGLAAYVDWVKQTALR
jgi:periplasmic divalent cation tolerance protein